MRVKGYVTLYRYYKGVGFARTEIDGERVEVWLHFSYLQPKYKCMKLEHGQPLEFDVVTDEDGRLAARNIVPVIEEYCTF